MPNSEFMFARHSLRPDPPSEHETGSPESKDYPGITEEGVELAKARVNEIIETIEHLSPDGILFIGGASQLARAQSTAKVFGDTLAAHYADSETTKVYTQANIEQLREQARKTPGGKVIELVKEFIAANSDKRLVIDYPLFVKEFSLVPEFVDPTSKTKPPHTPYAKALFKAVGGYEAKGADIFMRSGGEISADGETIHGASPQDIAERHIQGIKRLHDFVTRIAPDRQVMTYIVGHAWILDALAAYLANNGKANAAGWEKTGSTMIDKTEMGKVTIQNGKTIFTYRGKDFEVPPEILAA